MFLGIISIKWSRQTTLGLQDFRACPELAEGGLTPSVGATLVVARDWARTRPAPPFSLAPRIPKETRGCHFPQMGERNIPLQTDMTKVGCLYYLIVIRLFFADSQFETFSTVVR